METTSKQWQETSRLLLQVNAVAKSLGRAKAIFSESFPSPSSASCSEAGFLKSVAWYYILYYETGRRDLEFLFNYFNTYQIDITRSSHSHYRIVHNLRTAFQHGLSLDDDHDSEIQQGAIQWISSKCGTENPSTDKEWSDCVTMLNSEAQQFLLYLTEVIVAISRDKFKDDILREWEFRVNRYRPPHEYDRLIQIVASDMGQEHLNPVNLRNKYYESWTKELSLRTGNFDFEIEARKLIERELIQNPVLPIIGPDIITRFGITPGPAVGKALAVAKKLYSTQPCSKEDLLNQLGIELKLT